MTLGYMLMSEQFTPEAKEATASGSIVRNVSGRRCGHDRSVGRVVVCVLLAFSSRRVILNTDDNSMSPPAHLRDLAKHTQFNSSRHGGTALHLQFPPQLKLLADNL